MGEVWLSASDREEACDPGHRDGGAGRGGVKLGRQAASYTVGRGLGFIP